MCNTDRLAGWFLVPGALVRHLKRAKSPTGLQFLHYRARDADGTPGLGPHGSTGSRCSPASHPMPTYLCDAFAFSPGQRHRPPRATLATHSNPHETAVGRSTTWRPGRTVPPAWPTSVMPRSPDNARHTSASACACPRSRPSPMCPVRCSGPSWTTQCLRCRGVQAHVSMFSFPRPWGSPNRGWPGRVAAPSGAQP